jgi:N-acetylneuraminic acid mutarotase
LFLAPAAAPFAAEPSFEERVRAEEAIARVYHAHQVGETRPFSEAVPRAALEERVRAMLEKSARLEREFHTPITPVMLERELQRIERATRMPERLREIEAALGADRRLLRECLARATLADRLLRNFTASSGEPAPSRPRALPGMPPSGGTGAGAGVGTATAGLDAVLGPPAPQAPTDLWDNASFDDVPDPRERTVAVWTGTLMLVFGGVSGDDEFMNSGGRYDPLTDSWSPMSRVNAPSRRAETSAVWTGSEMLVWGGVVVIGGGSSFLNSGGRYNPATDTWTAIPTAGAPVGRYLHTAVWTGSAMIVWGGFSGGALNSGGRFDPAANTWTPTSTLNAPSARTSHAAIWTGSRMIIWGSGALGGRYDPATDTWTSVATANAPATRNEPGAVWTGTRMLVWGGHTGGSPDTSLNTGGQYDPVGDTWSLMTTAGAPAGRFEHVALWTGSAMIVWGGEATSVFHDGARYDPAADSWTPMTSAGSPSAGVTRAAVWTGDRVIVWGGNGPGGVPVQTGGRYDPAADLWTPTAVATGPGPRSNQSAVWSGNEMIVWGGYGLSYLQTGGRYDPALDHWTPIATVGAPTARSSHTAVWASSRMVVWGGEGASGFLADGGRYDPLLDTWLPTSLAGAPGARSVHSAVWTGSTMVIWGGVGGTLDQGGRYDPNADTWQPITPVNAPELRSGHVAGWTGTTMIVWGGASVGALNTGGRYDPAGDSWSPVTTLGAPVNLSAPAGVWTGDRMVVWGSSGSGTGGRYDPIADAWAPTSTINAPIDRRYESAIWTGTEMFVWGGYTTSDFEGTDPKYFTTGGRYNPQTDMWTATTTAGVPTERRGSSTVWTGSRVLIWGGYYGTGLASGGQYVLSDWIDADHDGHTVGQGDCNDADATVWGIPGEVSGLMVVATPPTTLAWSSQAAAAGPGTLYDVVSIDLGPKYTQFDYAAAVCLGTSGSAGYSDGRTDPPLGRVYWYHVRARNSCATGTWGTLPQDTGMAPCP